MGRARVTVLVPNPKEGFYLPASREWRWARWSSARTASATAPTASTARTRSAPPTTRTRSSPRPSGALGSPDWTICGGAQPRRRRPTTSPGSARLPRHPRPRRRALGRQHRSMDTLVVSGAIANRHLNSGGAWVRLSWVLGLRRLGFDVWFVEQIDEATCVDAAGAPAPFAESENRRYFDEVVERFGLEGRASLLYEGGRESAGVPLAELLPVAQEAELLVNLSGHLSLEPLLSRIGARHTWTLIPVSRSSGTPIRRRLQGGWARLLLHDRREHRQHGLLDPDRRAALAADSAAGCARRLAGGGDEGTRRFTTIASWRGAFGPVSIGRRTYWAESRTSSARFCRCPAGQRGVVRDRTGHPSR